MSGRERPPPPKGVPPRSVVERARRLMNVKRNSILSSGGSGTDANLESSGPDGKISTRAPSPKASALRNMPGYFKQTVQPLTRRQKPPPVSAQEQEGNGPLRLESLEAHEKNPSGIVNRTDRPRPILELPPLDVQKKGSLTPSKYAVFKASPTTILPPEDAGSSETMEASQVRRVFLEHAEELMSKHRDVAMVFRQYEENMARLEQSERVFVAKKTAKIDGEIQTVRNEIATKSVNYLKWEANAQADVESKVQAVSQKYLAPLCLARPPAAARDAVLVQIPACYSVCRTRPVPQDVLPGRVVQAKGDAGQGTVR